MSEAANKKLQQLLRATANGDARAFKALYDETSPRLHGVALTMMQDPGLAEDILQDAFVQIWHRAGEFHAERGSVFTWLTTIVRYRGIDMLRKRGQGTASVKAPPVDVGPGDFDFLRRSDNGGDETRHSGPLAGAIASEENARLHDCIDRLSDNQQRSVALAFFRSFTHQELADCLSEPLGTIKSRLRRSLMRLKECLETLGEGNEIRRSTS